jgi:hypothetical protein
MTCGCLSTTQRWKDSVIDYGGLSGFGGGTLYANAFQNKPTASGQARLGFIDPLAKGNKWQRTFHFDMPHVNRPPYTHFNADAGPLKRLNHQEIPPWLFRVGSTSVLRTIGRMLVVIGVAGDIYAITNAGPYHYGLAIGGAAGGWTGA